MPDWPVLVQAPAAIVQAATAVVIVRLTVRLAKANEALSKAPDSYAQSARDQVDQLVTARLATIQPYLHLIEAGVTGAPDPYLIGLGVQVGLVNLGSGPALDAVAHLEHDRLKFSAATPPQTVAAADHCEFSFTVSASTTDPGGLALSQDIRLVVEYRDLAGRWWVTTTPATLGYSREALGTYGQPQVSFRGQEETVEPLPAAAKRRSSRSNSLWATRTSRPPSVTSAPSSTWSTLPATGSASASSRPSPARGAGLGRQSIRICI